jgi:FkbM family methyltransferase
MKISKFIDGTKSQINELLSKFGYEIKLNNKKKSFNLVFNSLIKEKKINLVLDIGANEGSFISYLLKNNYKEKIIAFEPLLKVYQKLSEKFHKYPNIILENCAVGNINLENIEINISKNLVSSSVLNICPSHLNSEPDSTYTGSQKTKLITINDYAKKNNIIFKKQNTLIKIDTQGFEYEVLLGCMDISNNVSLINIELSLIKLYENQKLMHEIMKILYDNNFVMYHFSPVFRNLDNGQVLQVDGLFVNTKKQTLI